MNWDWQPKVPNKKIIKTVTADFLTVVEFKVFLAELAATASTREQNYQGYITNIEEKANVNNTLYHDIFKILKNYD